MIQAEVTEPEDLPENLLLPKEAGCSPPMGIREHAALVEAIMQNFPEIYFKSKLSNVPAHLDEPECQRQSIHPSEAA